MINKINSQANIESMLATLRQHQVDSSGKTTPSLLSVPAPEVGKPTFSEAIEAAVIKTNDSQQHASSLRQAYDRGEDVPLTDVVLAMQKSSLAFEATMQIRNKVLKAYEDILNMPV
jgi:flagellar hook-basal body complex protein FliE